MFAPAGSDPYAAVVSGSPSSVMLVLRGGTPLFGRATLVDQLRPGCDTLHLPDGDHRLCTEPSEPSAAALEQFARDRSLYPLACPGTPLNEPACTLSNGETASAA